MPIQISCRLDARTAVTGAALNRRFDCPVTSPVVGSGLTAYSHSLGSSAGRSMSSVLVNFAVFHDKDPPPDRCNVLQRISIHGHNIRSHIRRNGAKPVSQSQRLSRRGGSTDDGVHGLLAAVLHAVNKLFRVA